MQTLRVLRRADYLDALNAEQRRAAEFGTGENATARPLLVIAGAGTGKTATLAHRVAHLIAQGTSPQRILLLTFSRRAAAEMRRRVEAIVGRATAKDINLSWAGTFHSIGARLLREYARNIGIDPAFNILDRDDSADLMNLMRNDLGLSGTDHRFPTKEVCLAIYSRAINSEADLEELLADLFPWCRCWLQELKALFAAYVEAKLRQNLMDYDDLLLYWSQAMTIPEIATDIGARFDHVLVDEYQDTNRLQSLIIGSLKPDGHGVTVVGDDAQAIYSFRAATVRNIRGFPGQYQPAAEVITLEQNYRSTLPILAASNAVIGLSNEGFAKRLWSERRSNQKPRLVTLPDGIEQARYVAESILENAERGQKLKSHAVLFRAGPHSAQLEIELARREIPYVKFGGHRFLDSAHIKDVLAVLRVSTDPRDIIALFRVLLLIPGIGTKTAGSLVGAIAASMAPYATLEDFAPPQMAASAWSDFLCLVRRLRSTLGGWPSEFDAVRTWYEPFLETGYADPRVRLQDLEQLSQIAGTFPSREAFLTELALDPPEAADEADGTWREDDDHVVLSTIHSAKGLEWSTVFLLNAVDGCIPLAAGTLPELEEERRLLYVAMTRAKDDLHVLQPRLPLSNRSAVGDRTAARTRFIPSEIADYFDQIAWPGAHEAKGASSNVVSRYSIADDVRGMWK